eukprot:5332892-Amphidinium_carterae.1
MQAFRYASEKRLRQDMTIRVSVLAVLKRSTRALHVYLCLATVKNGCAGAQMARHDASEQWTNALVLMFCWLEPVPLS